MAHLPLADGIVIRPAAFPDDLDRVRHLFGRYAAGLEVDLGFQDFEQELRTLPGKYAAPDGVVLIALQAGQALGCVAMRPLGQGVCEMKRLFVLPQGRGRGLGRELVKALMTQAGRAGHRRMCLDTLPEMQAAQRLYASLGFRDIAPYVFNPVPGTRYLACNLGEAGL